MFCFDSVFLYTHILYSGLQKKLTALAKEKDCQDLYAWIKSIINHMYYTAAHARSPDQLEGMWVSIANHIQNIHIHENPHFPRCLHPALQRNEQKKWLKPCAYNNIQLLLTK